MKQCVPVNADMHSLEKKKKNLPTYNNIEIKIFTIKIMNFFFLLFIFFTIIFFYYLCMSCVVEILFDTVCAHVCVRACVCA